MKLLICRILFLREKYHIILSPFIYVMLRMNYVSGVKIQHGKGNTYP